ncbi:MAG: hypothetical protein OIN84_15770, partial [Candidatus Methanoperedens sp.]|nr:hypothetical protein [Candidatus Methanoperedens sp.]
MARHAELAEIQLPDFGMPTFEPEIPAEVYRKRLKELRVGLRRIDYDTNYYVIYADREHSANLAYLTGYDPRFEEALLVIDVENLNKKPLLLVGNEGIGYINISPVIEDFDVVLFQSFSLMGQPRDKIRPLKEILTQY